MTDDRHELRSLIGDVTGVGAAGRPHARHEARERLRAAMEHTSGSRSRGHRGRRLGARLAIATTTVAVLTAGTVVGIRRLAEHRYASVRTTDIPGLAPASSPIPTPGPGTAVPTTPVSEGAVNVLLVGSDRRADPAEGVKGERADAIVLVHLDPTVPSAYAVSIPRDTWVSLPDGTPGRIDTALDADGGPGTLVEAVRANFGVSVQHYVEIDLAGLVGVVDALGGIDVFTYFPSRDRLSGLDVGGGCQHLDGDQALAWARSRHLEQFVDGRWTADPTGDLGRIRREQDLLRRVAATVAIRVRHDPLDADRITSALFPFLTVDSGLDLQTVVDLLGRLAHVDPATVPMLTLPVHDAVIGGASVLTWDPAEAAPFLTPSTGTAVAPTTTALPATDAVAALPPTGAAGC